MQTFTIKLLSVHQGISSLVMQTASTMHMEIVMTTNVARLNDHTQLLTKDTTIPN